jgi:hypothetical protein
MRVMMDRLLYVIGYLGLLLAFVGVIYGISPIMVGGMVIPLFVMWFDSWLTKFKENRRFKKRLEEID